MDILTELYNQFDPGRPLEPRESLLYVDWQERLGHDDIKKLLGRPISRGPTPTCRLLTGHRGVGKTTELKRLAEALREGDFGRRFFVSFLEAESSLDLADLEPADIVLSVVRKLVDDFEAAGVSFARQRFHAFLGEFSDAVKRDVDLERFQFTLGAAGVAEVQLGAALQKGAPAVRSALRNLLQGQQVRLFDLINEVIQHARKELRKRDYEDILVIVDGLEKVRRKVLHERDNITNHENIFVDNAPTLKFLDCQALYTAPVELVFSHCRERLKIDYREIIFLPVITVRQRSNGQPNPAGVDALCEIIQRRCKAAGVRHQTLFENQDGLQEVVTLSGGHLRGLFVLFNAILDRSDTIPFAAESVNRAVLNLASQTAFGLRPGDWAVLRAVHQTKGEPDPGQCPAFAKDPEIWYRQLRDLFAFAYSENQQPWYDWNPLLGKARPEEG